MRGDYKTAAPIIRTMPLMPGTIGLMAQVTGNPLWTGRIIGILGNTLAVAVAILLIRRLFPLQPWLAWLTGVGLAINHIWCRTAVFMVTENFFYPLLLLLLLIFPSGSCKLFPGRDSAFGAVWAVTLPGPGYRPVLWSNNIFIFTRNSNLAKSLLEK